MWKRTIINFLPILPRRFCSKNIFWVLSKTFFCVSVTLEDEKFEKKFTDKTRSILILNDDHENEKRKKSWRRTFSVDLRDYSIASGIRVFKMTLHRNELVWSGPRARAKRSSARTAAFWFPALFRRKPLKVIIFFPHSISRKKKYFLPKERPPFNSPINRSFIIRK